MKRCFSFFFLMSVLFCSAQTFTLDELEKYSKYNFDEFSNKALEKGYEFYTVKDENIWFKYTASTVKHTYALIYNSSFVSYTTTNKTNYNSLQNSIESKKYKYFDSDSSSDRVCYLYENSGYTLRKCLSNLEDKTPVYVFRIINKNNAE